MDSKRSTKAILFLAINLVLFVVTSGCNTCPQPKPNPNPNINNSPTSTTPNKCPRDALKLSVCANILNGALGAVAGKQPDHPCCTVLSGLLDLEVALCLCTALKANILGININIPISLSLLVSTCGNQLPPDFKCA